YGVDSKPLEDVEQPQSPPDVEEDTKVFDDRFPSELVSLWVDETGESLQHQWPTNSSDNDSNSNGESYYRSLLIHHTPLAASNYALACSYLLIERIIALDQHKVIGSGRLTECFESSGGNAAAATYVLICPQYQGKGCGRRLMALLEQEAERLGYHYIYLWTKTAVDFYKKIGYQTCHRVSLKRPCLKALSATSVQSLEAVLLHRNQRIDGGPSKVAPKKLETITLLPDPQSTSTEDDVWLRKRLVEHVGSTMVSKEERQKEIQCYVQNGMKSQPSSSGTISTTFYRWNPDIAWQQQIGPSCGLVAIRMIRDYYFGLSGGNVSTEVEAFPSLLGQAQESGYTQDGELFNADHLSDLLLRQIGNFESMAFSSLTVQTRDFDVVSVEELDATLHQGGLWIIPYDSNPRTKRPTNLQGKHAHWGIIVGIVYAKSKPVDGEEQMYVELTNDKPPIPFGDNLESHCYLCVQHSLSSQWAIAPLTEWKESNQQLTSMDDYKFSATTTGLNLQNQIVQVTCQGSSN
ncbi:MAG: hypothetical protein SGILL_003189, partial [Bacillariaceae sp.]